MRDWTSLLHFGHRSNECAHETQRAACPHGIKAIEIRFEWQARHFEVPQFSSKRKAFMSDDNLNICFTWIGHFQTYSSNRYLNAVCIFYYYI